MSAGRVDQFISDYHDKRKAASSALSSLAKYKILPRVALSEAESRWLGELLLRLSENPKALRELGYKGSKKQPHRDSAIALEYLLLREAGVKAEAASELLMRKWLESQSNIKRLISNRKTRAEAVSTLAAWRADRLRRGASLDKLGRAFAWKSAHRGRPSADMKAAAAEIEETIFAARLT